MRTGPTCEWCGGPFEPGGRGSPQRFCCSAHRRGFDQACRELATITEAAIIEWLRRGGAFTMPPLKRRKTLRRWVKDHTFTHLPFLLAVGLALGWYLRTMWPG